MIADTWRCTANTTEDRRMHTCQLTQHKFQAKLCSLTPDSVKVVPMPLQERNIHRSLRCAFLSLCFSQFHRNQCVFRWQSNHSQMNALAQLVVMATPFEKKCETERDGKVKRIERRPTLAQEYETGGAVLVGWGGRGKNVKPIFVARDCMFE